MCLCVYRTCVASCRAVVSKSPILDGISQGQMSQLIVTQEKLKRGSEELNKKLQNMEGEQVKGGDSHVTVT